MYIYSNGNKYNNSVTKRFDISVEFLQYSDRLNRYKLRTNEVNK